MTVLIGGVVLWSLLHLIPVVGRGARQNAVDRLGEGGYKGLFSVAMLAAVALIIFGWRGALPSSLYIPSLEMRWAGIGLTAVGFVLMAAANHPTRIGRIVRHPQLTGVLFWAVGHLLANGDSRSLVLFGGFAIWCVLTILLINRRDGAWVKPEPPSWAVEIIGVLIGLAVFGLFVFIHPWIAGVPLY
jgi:uncharacterized membrane protein